MVPFLLFLGTSAKLRKAIVSFDMSVRPSVRLPIRPHAKMSTPVGLILKKIDILRFFTNCVKKF